MIGVRCHNSSLTVPRMINPQSLHLWKCYLPPNFVRSLLQQLLGSGDSLQRLELDEMYLSPYEPLLDELLENLVAHHEVQKGQRKLELMLTRDMDENPTNLSDDFIEKWRERC